MNELAQQYEDNGFIVIREFLPPVLTNFLKEYFQTLEEANLLESGDGQVITSKAIYGDPAFDTILKLVTPMLSNAIEKELLPTYTYARIYFNGAELLPHLDRKECQHSFTLSLGGEYESLYPIWMKDGDKDIEMVALYPGDIVLYQGTRVNHWRDEFLGTTQFQVFGHMVDADGEYANQLFDTRPALGMKATEKLDWGNE
jgi:hypothetical protein